MILLKTLTVFKYKKVRNVISSSLTLVNHKISPTHQPLKRNLIKYKNFKNKYFYFITNIHTNARWLDIHYILVNLMVNAIEELKIVIQINANLINEYLLYFSVSLCTYIITHTNAQFPPETIRPTKLHYCYFLSRIHDMVGKTLDSQPLFQFEPAFQLLCIWGEIL